jgi:hypothetical protein
VLDVVVRGTLFKIIDNILCFCINKMIFMTGSPPSRG